MSTDLYGVRVIDIDGPTVLWEVFIVYSDIEALPYSTRFYASLAEETAPRHSKLHQDLRDTTYPSLDGDLYVAEVTCLEEAHPPFEELLATLPPSPPAPPVVSPGKRKPRHKEQTIRPIVFSYHQPDLNCGAGGWANEHLLPRGLFLVVYRNEALIAHLKKGESWGTTRYED
jgi:hypothetical protein